MNRKNQLFLITQSLILFILIACSSQINSTKNIDDYPQPKIVTSSEIPKSDLYQIDSMVFHQSSILSIYVQYSGGCEEHQFELLANDGYLKSIPPQKMLHLIHHANGDACRSIQYKKLDFDVSNLKYNGHQEIALKLRKESIIYKY